MNKRKCKKCGKEEEHHKRYRCIKCGDRLPEMP